MLQAEEVERELAGIQAAMRETQSDVEWCYLYVAQQALSWTLQPNCFNRPLNTIQQGQVMALTQTGSLEDGLVIGKSP